MTKTIIEPDESGDPARRQIVRNSLGIPFFVSDVWELPLAKVRIWKGNSAHPTSFSIMDTAHAPSLVLGTASFNGGVTAAIDSNDVIHIFGIERYKDSPDDSYAAYVTFNTITGLYGTREAVDALPYNPGNALPHGANISIDSNDLPHVVWSSPDPSNNKHIVYYNNRIGGTWKGTSLLVETTTAANIQPAITIDADNKPFISYHSYEVGITKDWIVALGNANDPSAFSLHPLGEDYNLHTYQTSLAIDLNGDHYIAKLDSAFHPSFRKHVRADSWNTWGNPVSNINVTDNPASGNNEDIEIVINGMDVYLFSFIPCYYDGQEEGGERLGWSAYKNDLWTDYKIIPTSLWEVSTKWAYWIDRDSTGANRGITGGRKEIDFVWYFESEDSETVHDYFESIMLTSNSVQMIIENL